MGGGESLDNAGNEAGAFWHRGDDDVFGVGVGSTANRSKAVECRDADCCGEVAVATATDGEAFDSPARSAERLGTGMQMPTQASAGDR